MDQYGPYFGAFAAANRNTVVANYRTIQDTLHGRRGHRDGSLFLIDARNDVQKRDWFAAAIVEKP